MYFVVVMLIALAYFMLFITRNPGVNSFVHVPSIALFLPVVVIVCLSFSWERFRLLFKLFNRRRQISTKERDNLLACLDDLNRHGRLLLELAGLESLLTLLSILKRSSIAGADLQLASVARGVGISLLPFTYALMLKAIILFPFITYGRHKALGVSRSQEERKIQKGSGLHNHIPSMPGEDK